jgi:hypothetical protein
MNCLHVVVATCSSSGLHLDSRQPMTSSIPVRIGSFRSLIFNRQTTLALPDPDILEQFSVGRRNWTSGRDPIWVEQSPLWPSTLRTKSAGRQVDRTSNCVSLLYLGSENWISSGEPCRWPMTAKNNKQTSSMTTKLELGSWALSTGLQQSATIHLFDFASSTPVEFGVTSPVQGQIWRTNASLKHHTQFHIVLEWWQRWS